MPLTLIGAAGGAAAQEEIAAESAAEPEDSLAIGRADDGRLEHPFTLHPSDDLVVLSHRRHGTRELVGLLRRAASAVARRAPGSQLAVGDLSRPEGGPFPPHISHQNGRDADIGFYVTSEAGHAVPTSAFVRFGPDGVGRRRDGARFRYDVARNFALLSALVDDPFAGVQHVLVAPHLRDRMLAWGEQHAPNDVERVRLVTEPIRGSDSHDDHFHVRIYCSVGDRPQCLDAPPLHPWYDGSPSPDAVAAARAADRLRAAAERRQQDELRRQNAALEAELARQAADELARAAELADEPARQAAAERDRAIRQQALWRRYEADARRRDRALADEGRRARAAERARAAAAEREARRQRLIERRWATRHERREARQREEMRRRQAAAERRMIALRRRAERDLQRMERSRETTD